MLIKYKEKNGFVALTEIQDVDRNGSTVIFTPIGDKFYNLEIRNITESEYEKIINDLYLYGKSDLTSFANRTRWDRDDDEEEVDEDDDGKDTEEFDLFSSGAEKNEEKMTEAVSNSSMFGGWFKKK